MRNPPNASGSTPRTWPSAGPRTSFSWAGASRVAWQTVVPILKSCRRQGCRSSRRLPTSLARWQSPFLDCVGWPFIRMRLRGFTTFGSRCPRNRAASVSSRHRTANWPRPSAGSFKTLYGVADASRGPNSPYRPGRGFPRQRKQDARAQGEFGHGRQGVIVNRRPGVRRRLRSCTMPGSTGLLRRTAPATRSLKRGFAGRLPTSI